MRTLLAAFAALLGMLLIPVALVSPTVWLVPPAHLAFSVVVSVGAVLEAVAGHPDRARLWGAGYLVASIAMVAGMQVGSDVEGRAYWYVPWLVVLLWGWAPAVVAGLAGWVGEPIRTWRSDRAVRRRHAERRLASQ